MLQKEEMKAQSQLEQRMQREREIMFRHIEQEIIVSGVTRQSCTGSRRQWGGLGHSGGQAQTVDRHAILEARQKLLTSPLLLSDSRRDLIWMTGIHACNVNV